MKAILRMTRTGVAVAAAMFAGVAGFAGQAQTSADQAPGAERTLTGVVTDAMCGRTHMMKGKSDAECLRYCVKNGTKYALLAGKTVYTLQGHEADLDRYAAQEVTVTGRVTGTTVAVSSVAPTKKTPAPGQG